MEGLRENARRIFDSCQEWFRVHTLYCMNITRYSNESSVAASLEAITCPPGAPEDGCLERLQNWANKDPEDVNGEALQGIMKLVIIQQNADLSLGVHEISFKRLFRLFDIDYYILYLMARNVDGFYDPRSSTDRNVASFYLHVRNSHMVLWSFNRAQGRIRGIVICRQKMIPILLEEMQAYKEVVDHPLMPLLACCGHLLHKIDAEVDTELKAIAKVEQQTGFY